MVRPHVDLRLVVELELLAARPTAHVQLPGACGRRPRLHLRGRKSAGVAPGTLGLVQRHVGLLEQFIHRLAHAGTGPPRCWACCGGPGGPRPAIGLAQHGMHASGHVWPARPPGLSPQVPSTTTYSSPPRRATCPPRAHTLPPGVRHLPPAARSPMSWPWVSFRS
jgi:hypothetical protein